MSTPRGPRELERERAVFLGALEIKPDQREAYLQEACGGDAPLRRRAEALLAAYGDESDTLDDAAALSEFELPVGTLIGRYRLLNQIGEGGFGVVYEAEQTRPVSRRVALKIIKPGMDSRRVIARFEAERQALALMDHPGIAHVYDAGTTETGRPYFVMEYIGGCPITDYCDARRLAIRDRLALVREVCLAIQHAHQRGIIHRDIKPSNVLVTEVDGRAVPKIIDFGVAKSLSVRLTERTLFTETGSVIGTPEYMSPEQADLGGVDVDTRTDVYSLGVLLYELLAGTPPFEPARFRSASLREIQRILREEPAPRPSARLSTLLAEHQQSRVAAIAERRRSTLEELRQQLRRELEWIPLKAVRKDRNERYPTALGLAEDIQRYLEHRPLLAGPPSTIYIVRKFVRKNWVGVGVAAAFGLLIVLGLVGTGLGFARAERERRLAESRAEELEAALSFQIAQLKGLEPSSLGGGIREHLVAFVRESMLKAGVTPDVIETRMALLEDELEPVSFTTLAMHTLDEHIYTRSLEAAQTEFADRPLLRARVLQALADVLRTRGLLDEAVAPQGEALAIRTDMLGVEAPETLESCLASGRLLLARTDYESAIETFRDVGDTGERVLGEGHPTTIGAWTGLADTHWVFRRFDQVGEIRARVVDALEATAGPDDPATLEAVSQLAAARWQQLRHLEAERLFRVCAERSARVLGDADWRTIKTRVQLAQLLTHMDRHDDAIALVDRAMADMDQHGGSTSPESQRLAFGWLAEAHNNLRYELLPDVYDRMIRCRRREVEIARGLYGGEHPETLAARSGLGLALRRAGRLDEADGVLTDVLRVRRRVLGPDHERTLTSLDYLGLLREMQGRFDEALAIFEEYVSIRRSKTDDQSWLTINGMRHAARQLVWLARPGEAEAIAREAYGLMRGSHGEGTNYELFLVDVLVWACAESGRIDQAESFLGELDALIDDFTRSKQPTSTQIALARAQLTHGSAAIRIATGRFDEAERELLEAHTILVAASGPGNEPAVHIAIRLARMYDAWHDAEPGAGHGAGHDARADEWWERLPPEARRQAGASDAPSAPG